MTPHPACTANRHGTATAANNHGCTCPAARAARRRQHKRACNGHPADPVIDATGAQRRIHALYAAGWTRPQIASRAGKAADTITSIVQRPRCRAHTLVWVDAVYNLLRRLPAPTGKTATAQRTWAAGRGLAPAWVWDGDLFNIDDPQADPAAAIATFGLAPPLRRLAMLDHAHAAALAEHPERARALRLAYFHSRRAAPVELAEAS